MQGLTGKSDIDADGIITMKELELYVTEEMPRRSANKWKSIQNSINDLKEQNFLLYAPSNK